MTAPSSTTNSRSPSPKATRKEIFAWAMYDWANSAFTTLSITMLVIYISDVVLGGDTDAAWWIAEQAKNLGFAIDPRLVGGTFWAWGLALAMLTAALLSPIVGAMADARATKRRWLAGTAFVGAISASMLYFVPYEQATVVLILFVFSALCFDLSFGFYNGFLPELADEKSMNRVSAFGYALGYVGGAVALGIGILIFEFGGTIGMPDGDDLARDFHYSQQSEFGVTLPENGKYRVTVQMGDPAGARDQMQLELVGKETITFGPISTDAGEIHTVERTVEISNGQLLVRLKDLGGDDSYAVINALAIEPVDIAGGATYGARFDFGRYGSPTDDDYIRVVKDDTHRIWTLHRKKDAPKKMDFEKEKVFDTDRFITERKKDDPGPRLQSLEFGWRSGQIGSHDAVSPLRLQTGLLIMGLWWGIFTIPTIVILRDKSPPTVGRMPFFKAGRKALSDVRQTIGHLRRYKTLVIFLFAFLFFNDGIQTVINQSPLYATKEINFHTDELIILILVFQVICFPGAILVSYAADRLGQKPILIGCLVVWSGLLGTAYFITEKWEYWALSVVLGLVMGGTQSIARSIMAVMTPRSHSAEFFGFFNFSGKATSWMGNGLFGIVLIQTGSVRIAIAVLLVFFIIGLFLVLKINIQRGQDEAAEGDDLQ